jgi:hypothetical protein
MQTGIKLLEKQIEEARGLLKHAPIVVKDNKAWNEQTAELLTRIYGEGSPNIDTIVKAAGEAPVWLFMPGDAAEKSEASRLEIKIKLLEGCVVALKKKADEYHIQNN